MSETVKGASISTKVHWQVTDAEYRRVAEQLQEENLMLRIALTAIAAHESGSRGAYSKFRDCQDIARRYLALAVGKQHE